MSIKFSNDKRNAAQASPVWKMAESNDGCILMFSGGRDSSIAAARLAQKSDPLHLVTVSSGHLFGIERVRNRVRELKPVLAPATRWLRVRQPTDLKTDVSFYEMTCLPCHHSYVVVSAMIAAVRGVRRLAFGYASYQSNWPEQTPLAIERLERVLSRHGISLELPVYDLESRDQAVQLLSEMGVSTASLEQKCIQQISNVTLSDEKLKSQINLWESAIDRSMARLDQITIEVLEDADIRDVQ